MAKLWKALKSAGSDFSEDECMTAGAAIAYYTIFSLPPLLVLVFMVAGAFGVSGETINRVVRNQLGLPVAAQGAGMGSGGSGSQNTGSQSSGSSSSGSGQSANPQDAQADSGGGGQQGATDLGAVAGRADSTPAVFGSLGVLSRVIGILVLLFSATGVFAQFQAALNRAWEVEPDPEAGGVKSFLFKRFFSAGMIAVAAFLLLVSLVLTTLVDEFLKMIQGVSPGVVAQTLGIALNVAATVAIATALFAAMYKILPDAKMRWKDTWVAALITAVLFVIGKTAIGWYIQYSNLGSDWGSAAASMIGMLVWVYYTSLIVLFGAEIAQFWAAEHGAGIEPARGAVRIREHKEHVR